LIGHQFITSHKLVIAFFATAILFPIISYGQQTPVKRVDIVVSVVEKPGTAIVQLPATNLPKAVDKKSKNYKTKIYKKRKSTPSTHLSPKNIKPNLPAVAKIKAKTLSTKSKVVEPVKPKQQISPNQTSLSKLKPIPQQKEELKSIEKPIQKEEKPKFESSSNKVDNAFRNADVEHNNAQISDTDKQNTISYVWIGVILIVAGIVLGLLFGRTAFLVSFIGVIFILLGIFI
jgi:hypothetical protein